MPPTQGLLLHRSLEKWEANNINKLHLILLLPVDVYIWGSSLFSFQVCSASGIQPSLWSKWRPYLFLVFPFPHPSLLSITPWPFTDWLQLRPWISSSWTKVRLQCKNNKGKTNVLQSSMYSPQTAFGVKLYLELPHFKSLKTQTCWFGNLSAFLLKKILGSLWFFSSFSFSFFEIKKAIQTEGLQGKTYWFCLSSSKTEQILDTLINMKFYSIYPVHFYHNEGLVVFQ